MTTRFTRIFAATLAAALIGIASLPAPAMAGGQFSVTYSPSNSDQQRALGLGLSVYSLIKGVKSGGAYVSQRGNNNSAGGSQNGWGNSGIIVQKGNNHTGIVQQNGNNNSCGLFQFGKNTNAACSQNGNSQSSLTTVFGF
jgi:hypothetical protein